MISRQLGRAALTASKSLAKSVGRQNELYLANRLIAGFGSCNKLSHQAKEFEKVLLYNSEKVIGSFKGSKLLLQLAALLGSTYSTPNPRKYKHTLQLFMEVAPLLKPLLEKEATSSMEMAGVLTDCLEGITIRMKEQSTVSDNSDLQELHNQITAQEIEFLHLGLEYVAKAYPLLNIEEKELFKSALDRLHQQAEGLPDGLRTAVSNVKERVGVVDLLPSATYTEAMLDTLGLKNYIKTESSCFQIEATNSLSRRESSNRLKLHDLNNDSTLNLFVLSDTDIKGQTLKMGEFFSKADKLQSLAIDAAPVINPGQFDQKDANKRKIYEYSQYLTKDWPFLYKFVGRPALRGYYTRLVFDREFFVERDQLLYYKMNQKNEVFDAWSSVKALFMGVGDRPKVPALYLSGLVSEERVLAAMAGLGSAAQDGWLNLQQAEQLHSLVGAYNIVCGLRSFRETQLAGGCLQCGAGDADMHNYFNRCERAGAGLGRGRHEGKVGAGVVFEAFEQLESGHSGAVGWSEGMFDHGLPFLLEYMRQKRFGVEDRFKRETYIRGVYSEISEKQSINNEFMQKLAVVENVLGVMDTTINQFVDLLTTEQLLMAYELKKEQLATSQILLEWSPGYVDTTREEFCAVENCILPCTIDDSKYDHKLSKVWEVEDKNIKEDFMTTVEKRLDAAHTIEETDKPEKTQRGRKIKTKASFRAEEEALYQAQLEAKGLTEKPQRGSEKPIPILRQKRLVSKAASSSYTNTNYDLFDDPKPNK